MIIEGAFLCLALNVYKEARGEPFVGQQAVALVTLNRVAAAKGDRDVCAVVLARKQFSWTITDVRDGKLLPGKVPDRTSKAWKRAERAALEAVFMRDFTGGATHFHTTQINPYWAPTLQNVGTWGNHIFYRKKHGNQHSSEGAGRGARSAASAGAYCAQGDGRDGHGTARQGHCPAQSKPERGWRERLVEHVRDVYRGEAPRAAQRRYVVGAVREVGRGAE